MDELISRQAAIDALRKLREEDIEDYGCEIPEGFNQDHLDRATFAIKQLPSAEPKRGKWIDRAQAIDALDKRFDNIPMEQTTEILQLRRDLRQLPSAEPKTGKWILDRSGAYCCSECMEPCAGYVMMKPRDKYCKMCGAKMEVTE